MKFARDSATLEKTERRQNTGSETRISHLQVNRIWRNSSMADERKQEKQNPQTPDQEKEQKRRPGGEQEYQGGQPGQKRNNTDQEREAERKRA
jgi:hypothetical protein